MFSVVWGLCVICCVGCSMCVVWFFCMCCPVWVTAYLWCGVSVYVVWYVGHGVCGVMFGLGCLCGIVYRLQYVWCGV